MEIQVFKNTPVREITDQFSHYFPFLKLEFFMYRHNSADGSPARKEVYNGLYVEESSEFFQEGTVNFSPSTTIAELEQKFQTQLGLPVKVFRRSRDLWIDTMQTNHLTLAKQNSMGAAASRPVKFNLNTLFL